MDLVYKLKAVAFELSKIEVHGRDNLEGLLGSIQLLDQIIKEESNKPKEPEVIIKEESNKPKEPEVTIQEIPAE